MGRNLLLCTLLLLPVLGSAKGLHPTSNRIDSVTVFLDRAEITRQVGLNLPAGAHTILISGLPAQLFEASLRAKGRGPAGLQIATVEIRRQFTEAAASEMERKLREQLQSLKDEQSLLEGRRKALDTQAKFIEQLAHMPAEQDKNGNRLFTPEKWPAAWQAIGKGMMETNTARAQLKQQQRELKRKLRKVEQELKQIQTGRRDTITAAIRVEAAKPGKAIFDLTYQLGGASWSPLYDASLKTESGKVTLTQAANIRQSTGEDWNNARLTVSTSRPSAGAAMPELYPWWIDFRQPRPVLREKTLMKQKREAEAPLAGVMDIQSAPAEAKEMVAQAVTSDFSVRYRIPGRVTVPADNSKHRFVLNKQQLHAQLTARSAPKLDKRAFLYGQLEYQGETPLLPGLWQLQRDGTFVGTQRNKALRPGEKVALAFGADDAIEIDYKLLKDERSEEGLLNRDRRIARRYRIGITNHHQRKLTISIFDQLPVSRDEDIQVALSEDATKPNNRDVEDRAGVLEWKRTFSPEEKWQIHFGYDVSYPKDKKIPGF